MSKGPILKHTSYSRQLLLRRLITLSIPLLQTCIAYAPILQTIVFQMCASPFLAHTAINQPLFVPKPIVLRSPP